LRSRIKRVVKYFHLKPREQIIFAKAYLLVTAIRLGLWILPYKVVRRLIAGIKVKQPKIRIDEDLMVKMVVWAVSTASRFIPKAETCLVHALAAKNLLARYGIKTELRFGVKKDENEELKAHAWVVHKGAIIIGGAGVEQFKLLKTKSEK